VEVEENMIFKPGAGIPMRSVNIMQ